MDTLNMEWRHRRVGIIFIFLFDSWLIQNHVGWWWLVLLLYSAMETNFDIWDLRDLDSQWPFPELPCNGCNVLTHLLSLEPVDWLGGEVVAGALDREGPVRAVVALHGGGGGWADRQGGDKQGPEHGELLTLAGDTPQLYSHWWKIRSVQYRIENCKKCDLSSENSALLGVIKQSFNRHADDMKSSYYDVPNVTLFSFRRIITILGIWHKPNLSYK